MRISKVLIALSFFLTVACGGSGSGGAGNNTSPRNDPPPAPVLISGTFVDSPVNGIDYVGLPSGTSGVTGDTGTAGGWQVEEGDTITFSISNLTLGLVSGTDGGVITPASLVGTPTDASNPEALRIAILLQSLDDDGDTSNGITITQATKDAMTIEIADAITTVLLSGTGFDSIVGGVIDDLTAGNTLPAIEGFMVSAICAEAELSDAITGTTDGGDCITPANFTFIAQEELSSGTEVTSNSITVAGINAATAISITGGTYSIDGGAYTSAAGTVTNGQIVTVRHTSSFNGSTSTDTLLTIGGVSSTFFSTTTPEEKAVIVQTTFGNTQFGTSTFE